jgi:hypothetical protein
MTTRPVGPSTALLRPPVRAAIVPKVGDTVWWAKKGVEGHITSLTPGGFVFASGGPCTTPSGKKVAERYSTIVSAADAVWHQDIHCWVVGRGPTPKNVRGQVIQPKPVIIKMGVN